LSFVVWAAHQIIFQPFRDYWFSLGMIDPAAMHTIIANAAMHRKVLRSDKQDDITALTHVTAAMKSINQRLSKSNQNVTNEIMGAILGVCG
jgi:hypothetical protein